MNALRKEKPKRKSIPHRHPRWPIVTFLAATVLMGMHSLTFSSAIPYSGPYIYSIFGGGAEYFEGPIIYPAFMFLHSDLSVWVVVMLLLTSFGGVAWRYRGLRQLLMMGVIVMMCGLVSLHHFYQQFVSRRPMHSVTITSYEDAVYYVAEWREACFDSTPCFSYFVFECDSLGIQCYVTTSSQRRKSPQSPEFQIGSDGQLQLVIGETIIDIPTE